MTLTVNKEPPWLTAYREKNKQAFEAWSWPERMAPDAKKWKDWLQAFSPVAGRAKIAEAKGTRVLTLEQALASHGDRLRQAFEGEQAPHDALEARANALFTDCFVLVVDGGKETPAGVGAETETVSWTIELGGQAAAKVVVLAEANARTKLLERVTGGNALLAETISLEPNADIVCTRIQLATGWNGLSQQQILGRDARFKGLNLWVEGENVKGSLCLALNGRGSSAEQFDAMLLGGKQKADVHLLTVHGEEHTSAYSAMRNVLTGRSTANFDGMIRILPKGQKTESKLEAHSLLLSKEAKSRNVPGLEIEADDVKAKHSASVAHIEEEPLFYLTSRGVPREEAQEMIIMGFLESLVHQMPPVFQDTLSMELRKKWAQSRVGAADSL